MQVLIPAAGMGKRLGEHTSNKTKAMVEVGGKTLIERCLDCVVKHPVNRIILIVGYEKKQLMDYLGGSYKGVDISYVENNNYSTTNNIYSVYLARKLLEEDDTILIESDLIFEQKILDMVFENKFNNLALVDKYKPWMDGTVVKMNNDFSISHFISKNDFNYDQANEYYKTVNIYKFSKEFLKDIYIPFLEAYSSALGENEYYEQVLKVIVNLDMRNLKALPLNGEVWYEIDDIQDLDNANLLFSDAEKRYELLNKRYGGYWRFEELIDFCYLVNPYFPTAAMLEEIKYSFDNLISSYPSGERVQSLLAAKLFDIPESCVVVGNGAAELIDSLARMLDGKFSLYGPTFEEYSDRFNNVEIRTIKTNGYRYGKKEVIELAQDSDGVILVNPDNPSGNYICYKDIVEILEELKNMNKCLIIDESFIDFAEGGFESTLLNSNDLQKYQNLFVIKSIGKSYGVGGIRLGVLASSNRDVIDQVKAVLPIWNINSVAEFYMQIIGKYIKDYKASCNKIISSRASLMEGLKGIDYLYPYESQANYIFCKVLGKKSKDVARILSEKYNILIKDCSGKHAIEGQYVRLAVRDHRSNEYLLNALRYIG